MPKPCSKPVKSNPFETYRDPVTGRWEVKHPASGQSEICDVEYLKRFSLEGSLPPLRCRWKSKPRTKVVA